MAESQLKLKHKQADYCPLKTNTVRETLKVKEEILSDHESSCGSGSDSGDSDTDESMDCSDNEPNTSIQTPNSDLPDLPEQAKKQHRKTNRIVKVTGLKITVVKSDVKAEMDEENEGSEDDMESASELERSQESSSSPTDDTHYRHPQAYNAPSRAHLIKATCKTCGLGLTSEKNRVLHVRMAHGMSSCKCLQEFATKPELRVHQQTCDDYKSYKSESLTACEICGKKMEKRKLVDHKKKHGINENGDVFFCSQCPKCFSRATSLMNHEKSVHQPDSERLSCPFCESRVKKRESLLYHVKTHRDLSGITPPVQGYTCSLCEHKDSEPADIKEHIITAHGVKKKRGPIGKREIHTEKKPDKGACCPYCGIHLARRKNLKNHMALHTMNKAEQCQICGRAFATKTYLKNHMRAMHSTEPRPELQCKVCFKTLASAGGLKKHMMIHNNEFKFSCQYCGKSCRSSYDLKVHERVHTGEKPFKCKQCGKDFSDVSNLRAHAKKHDNVLPRETAVLASI